MNKVYLIVAVFIASISHSCCVLANNIKITNRTNETIKVALAFMYDDAQDENGKDLGKAWKTEGWQTIRAHTTAIISGLDDADRYFIRVIGSISNSVYAVTNTDPVFRYSDRDFICVNGKNIKGESNERAGFMEIYSEAGKYSYVVDDSMKERVLTIGNNTGEDIYMCAGWYGRVYESRGKGYTMASRRQLYSKGWFKINANSSIKLSFYLSSKCLLYAESINGKKYSGSQPLCTPSQSFYKVHNFDGFIYEECKYDKINNTYKILKNDNCEKNKFIEVTLRPGNNCYTFNRPTYKLSTLANTPSDYSSHSSNNTKASSNEEVKVIGVMAAIGYGLYKLATSGDDESKKMPTANSSSNSSSSDGNSPQPNYRSNSTSSYHRECSYCGGKGNCTTCHGKGTLLCTLCDGKGVYSAGLFNPTETCYRCDGNKWKKCYTCTGNGACVHCSGTGKQ